MKLQIRGWWVVDFAIAGPDGRRQRIAVLLTSGPGYTNSVDMP
jgi:hypothetical protein